MMSKRERADSKEEAQSSDRLRYQKQSILSVCYLGCEDPPGRPSFSELKARLRRAYDTEEAVELLSFVEAREGDTAAFWSELDSVDMDRTAALPLDADVSTHIRLLARLETERHMASRMLLREKKQLQGKKRGQGPAEVFDANGSAEKALELVEALPQGSRGTQATHEGLFKLGRDVAGRDAPPERQVEFGLLLEEYTLELLQEYRKEAGLKSENTMPPLMDAAGAASYADVSQREAQIATRLLESLGVLQGAGYFQREPRPRRAVKRRKQEDEKSSDEYSV